MRIAAPLLILALLVGSCSKNEPGLAEVSGQLHRVLSQMEKSQMSRAPSTGDIREVFMPFEQALQRLSDIAQTDRVRWTELAREVRQLAVVAEKAASPGTGGQTELVAMRKRIETMEQRLVDQSAKQSAEKQLMIRALQASTKKLDDLFRAMVAPVVETTDGVPGPGEQGKSAGKPANKAAGKSQPAGKTSAGGNNGGDDPQSKVGSTESSMFGNLDLGQMLMIFLAVSLLLLVAIVVFFPGRLRHTVPQIEYTAEPDPVLYPTESPDKREFAGAGDGAAAGGNGTNGTNGNDNGDGKGPAIVPVSRNFPDPVLLDGNPVPHQLSLGLGDKKSLENLVDVLDSYLNTEPYILRKPAPRVAVTKGELHLSFYALPNLSKTEHALLDATVKRLQPPSTRAQTSDPAPPDSSENTSLT